jgi:hypothetical protein
MAVWICFMHGMKPFVFYNFVVMWICGFIILDLKFMWLTAKLN